MPAARGPIPAADLYCPRCQQVTLHHGHLTGRSRVMRCLACERRRVSEARQTFHQPRHEDPSEYDLQPDEQVCPRCYLTTCDCVT